MSNSYRLPGRAGGSPNELAAMISVQCCRERDLAGAGALIVQLFMPSSSKLAATREWHTTTSAEEVGLQNAAEDALY